MLGYGVKVAQRPLTPSVLVRFRLSLPKKPESFDFRVFLFRKMRKNKICDMSSVFCRKAILSVIIKPPVVLRGGFVF